MTQVTTSDIEWIISGDPVEIETDYPLNDQTPDFKWYMRQPPDWLLNMAAAARTAAVAEVEAMPELEATKSLPPSDFWLARQNFGVNHTKERIEALKAIDTRTVEQDVELANLQDLLESYIKPDNYTRYEEIVREASDNAYNGYLVPRLVIDDDGRLLFDPNNKDGRRRWARLKDKDKKALSDTLNHLLYLIRTAKN